MDKNNQQDQSPENSDQQDLALDLDQAILEAAGELGNMDGDSQTEDPLEQDIDQAANALDNAQAQEEPRKKDEPAAEPDQPVRKEFLQLAARERKMREDQQRRQKDLEEKEAQISQQAKLIEDIQNGDVQTRLNALNQLGLKLDKFVDDVANDGKYTTEGYLQKHDNELNSLREEIKQLREEKQQQEMLSTANQYISEFNQIIGDEKYAPVRDFYEFIGGAPTDELGDIYNHFAAEGKHLTAQDMADIILDEANKRFDNEKVIRVSKSEKAEAPKQGSQAAPEQKKIFNQNIAENDVEDVDLDDLPFRDRERILTQRMFG